MSNINQIEGEGENNINPALDSHPLIAREGWWIILVAVVVALIFGCYNSFLAGVAWLFVIFSLQFFRDPRRQPSGDVWSVLAPADGKVIAIEKCEDPIRKVPAVKVSIFMNVFNVHSNRSPINGTIISRTYFQGAFLNADFDKASEHNERNALVIKHSVSNTEITCIQIAGLIARRILCYVGVDENLERGQRYGFIRFGSRVDLYLPENVELKVGISDEVHAAIDVVAKLPQS